GATSKWRPACDTSGDGTQCTRAVRSSRPPRQEKRLEPLQGRPQLIALNGPGRINMFRTNPGAFANKRATPDTLMIGENLKPLAGTLIARVEIIALGKGDGGRADELGIEAIDGAGSIAEHAVNTHAELLVLVHLSLGLQVLAFGNRLLLLADDPGFDPC